MQDLDDDDGLSETAISTSALLTVILAGLGAITAMLSNYHADQAVIEQIQASDQWGYYQAKGIKGNLISVKTDLMIAFGKPALPADVEKINQYKKDQDEISESAREKERASTSHIKRHTLFARGVSFFEIAVVISAITILTRRSGFGVLSLLAGLMGIFFLTQGVIFKG
jgi:hypothetical protein